MSMISKHFQYGVYCDADCGLQELSEAEYNKQMDEPSAYWRCPSCGDSAGWDDDSLCMNEDD